MAQRSGRLINALTESKAYGVFAGVNSKTGECMNGGQICRTAPNLYETFKRLFENNSTQAKVTYVPCAINCLQPVTTGTNGWSYTAVQSSYGKEMYHHYTKSVVLNNQQYAVSITRGLTSGEDADYPAGEPFYAMRMKGPGLTPLIGLENWVDCDGTVRGFYNKRGGGTKDLQLLKSALEMIVGTTVHVVAEGAPYTRYITIPWYGDVTVFSSTETREVK